MSFHYYKYLQQLAISTGDHRVLSKNWNSQNILECLCNFLIRLTFAFESMFGHEICPKIQRRQLNSTQLCMSEKEVNYQAVIICIQTTCTYIYFVPSLEMTKPHHIYTGICSVYTYNTIYVAFST